MIVFFIINKKREKKFYILSDCHLLYNILLCFLYISLYNAFNMNTYCICVLDITCYLIRMNFV